ncbi:hypothetical protein E2C00_16795 [Streptomyces sp. WAC05374]|uniref:hypothetical protein n=1 Tax=Streptomyces sp. WAC05374 TaxID=2487420 RepID=UPI001054A3A1|nr:hypothetical protein [Streptomyces sp. WAC05374]TDF54583.1 hypothetical protein E2C00_16795 [Streptomyces sp. WAC05374]TDF56218.1 hypothetical protein E2C02_12250 [Streptomyces sp. WAC05374]
MGTADCPGGGLMLGSGVAGDDPDGLGVGLWGVLGVGLRGVLGVGAGETVPGGTAGGTGRGPAGSGASVR